MTTNPIFETRKRTFPSESENMMQDTKTDVTLIGKVPLKILNLSNTRENMKTIYVTTVSSSSESERCTPTPRKRQRLDHLSMDQKLMRRKLKNRVAAQNARDRKKTLMSDLEEQIQILQDQNERLQDENSKLHNFVTQILQENNKLSIQDVELIDVKEEIIEEDVIVEGELPVIHPAVDAPCEPAVFTTTSLPQRWEVVQLLMACWLRTSTLSALLMTPYLQWAVVAMLTGSKYSKNSWRKLEESPKTEANRTWRPLNPAVKWWGPHQNSWNPSKK